MAMDPMAWRTAHRPGLLSEPKTLNCTVKTIIGALSVGIDAVHKLLRASMMNFIELVLSEGQVEKHFHSSRD